MAILNPENQNFIKEIRTKHHATKGGLWRNQIMLLMGTGVSYGMVKSPEVKNLCNWMKFIEHLIEKIPSTRARDRLMRHMKLILSRDLCNSVKFIQHLIKKIPSFPARDWITDRINLVSVGNATMAEMLGVAHMARKALEAENCWLQTMKEVTQKIRTDVNASSSWARLFEQLRTDDKSVVEGSLHLPLFLTTNYDTLIEDALEARLLVTLDGGDSFQLLKGSNVRQVPTYLQEVQQVPLLWELHRDGLLGKDDSFVHHIHGSPWIDDATDPIGTDSIVLDPADYQRVIDVGLKKPLTKYLDQATLIVCGMGAGMYDRHLSGIWAELSQMSSPQPLVYWLVAEKEKKDLEEGIREELTRLLMPNLPSFHWLKIVSQHDYDWMPQWIGKVLSVDDTTP